MAKTKIEVVDLNGRPVTFEIENPRPSEMEAIAQFNREQMRSYSRQHKTAQRYIDRYHLEDYCGVNRRKPKNTRNGHVVNYVEEFTQLEDIRLTVQSVLDTCSLVQRERFMLWLGGEKYSDIAKMQHCGGEAVRQSVASIFKKIKKALFSALPNGL